MYLPYISRISPAYLPYISQARALTYTVDANASARMRSALCDRALPAHDPAGLCQGRIARHTLLQFSYFGLLEERCTVAAHLTDRD